MNHQCKWLCVFCAWALLLVLTRHATADLPLRAPEWAPQYQLSNPQMKGDLVGAKFLTFHFRRVRSGRGSVELRARGPQGPIDVSGVTFAFNQDSGEISLSPRMGFGFMHHEQPDVEFYLVSNATMAGQNFGKFLVSNVVSIGNPGPTTKARDWNEEEKAAIEREKLAKVPPEGLPDGHRSVSAALKLVPGMPIKAGYYGDWVDGEVIALKNDGQVGVKMGPGGGIVYFAREKWLAVHPDVLSRAHANPSEFTPSVRVLPGSRRPLPSQALPIPADLDLPPGTPLMLEFGGWDRVFVVEDRGDSIVVHRPGSPSFADRPEPRNEMAILENTLEKLNQPGAAEEFSKNVELAKKDDERFASFGRDQNSDEFNTGGRAPTVIERSYPIDITIPKAAKKLPTDVELPEGTIVAYCRGRRWQAAKVVSDDGDTVVVKREGSIVGFAYRLDRDELIIQTKTLRKLERNANANARELTQTLRTWTDSSGQHKIEARLVRVLDGEEVVLKTDAGREITLPLKRLSDEDQELLEHVGTVAENPFAP